MPAGVDGDEQRRAVHVVDPTSGERFRGLLPIMKHDTSSSTVGILTGWLNVALFRLGLKHRFTSPRLQGADLQHVLFPIHIPKLPDFSEYRARVSKYFRRVNTVYPILDREEVLTSLTTMQTPGIEAYLSEPDHLPHVIVVLLLLEMGSCGLGNAKAYSREVHVFCKDMIGRMIGNPTIPNVKALFLLAISAYQRDDLASTWPILYLCVSMAISVELNKLGPNYASSTHPEEEDRRRTWWSIFAFEKLLSFELGRQSSIPAGESSQLEPTVFPPQCTLEWDHEITTAENSQASTEKQEESLAFLKAIISLAKLLGEIGTQWAEDLPDNLRPNSDLIYDARTFPHAAFLSIHYQNALLVLTRNSLLISESALQNSTEVIAKNQPWGRVIRNGQSMVANIARRLVKLFIEAEEIGIPLLIPHVNASLHALYVLAVHLLRHPNSRLAEADLQFIHHAADFAKWHSNPLNSGTNAQNDLDRILGEISDIIKPKIGTTSRPLRNRHTHTRWQHQDQRPGNDPSYQHHAASLSSGVSLYTSTDTVRLDEQELFGQVPEHDTRSLNEVNDGSIFDASYYYGMDMGTWMGLDEIRCDWNLDILSNFQAHEEDYSAHT
ncbi:fungal-specific transcription factor domain-domain-containing protein [Clohesyomyces aquaticus]|uniref:Fungal-specific transcription factor domain-domain-containing protein n=1 Tax=Clohesyomyces aquaticus TaxID=1231657 RepID=A0A1Y1ZF19_9PLEO|nr:fungal-specific transcription factor domain-domain-containing protein [Clohesyomyces aquaticus]